MSSTEKLKSFRLESSRACARAVCMRMEIQTNSVVGCSPPAPFSNSARSVVLRRMTNETKRDALYPQTTSPVLASSIGISFGACRPKPKFASTSQCYSFPYSLLEALRRGAETFPAAPPAATLAVMFECFASTRQALFPTVLESDRG